MSNMIMLRIIHLCFLLRDLFKKFDFATASVSVKNKIRAIENPVNPMILCRGPSSMGSP
jgi:hypothetical protein